MAADDNYAVLRDPEMKEIFESFLIETKELLEQLDLDLVELEKNPEDLDLLNKIFRAFHTVKGTSGFLGLEKLMSLTHHAEDLLNKLRKGEFKLNIYLMDGILKAYDSMKELLTVIETNLNEDYDTEGVVRVLMYLLENPHIELPDGEAEEVPAAAATEAEPQKKPAKEKKPRKNKKSSAEEAVPAPVQVVDEIPDLQHEEIFEKEVLGSDEPEEEKEAAPVMASKSPLPVKDKPAQTAAENKVVENVIRVDVKRLDDLLNIVSELVLGRNRLSQVYSEASMQYEGTKLVRDLSEVSRQIDLMTTELQLAVMKTRMIKIGKVFNKFPRLVRDLAREGGKLVRLEIVGEDTELDKTLIEEINDPLVHLVRNAFDHGVELPEKRRAKGKPDEGIITLTAEHEGNNIMIIVQDDGNGIDVEYIRKKGVEKGFMSAERAKELTKQEVYNFLFMPGFSTAEKLTNISGRGVGLDVVKTNVTKLRGVINIDSEPGVGTKFIIKLPLTLAIIQGLLVQVGSEIVVVPLNSVLEVVRLHNDQVYTVKGKEVIKLREAVLPLFDVGDILYKAKVESESDWQYIVVVAMAERKFGIKVNSLIGQKEVVIKSLGSYLGNVKGIAGSTIMGDGRVVMILDLAEILHQVQH